MGMVVKSYICHADNDQAGVILRKLSTRICAYCGYENVENASLCWRCNRNLDDRPIIEGVRGAGELIEGALRFIRERGHKILEPSRIERLREARTKLLPENLNGEPITCLNCGAFNLSGAEQCTNCGAFLLVPDEDFGLRVRVSGRTSVGQVRTNNEDNVGVWVLDGLVLALIADGMGGAAMGEEASRLTAETVQASFLGEERDHRNLAFLTEDELGDRLRDAIMNANRVVVERSQRDATLKGMGTTSTLVMIRGNRAYIAHVGDSRAYHIDQGTRSIVQVTSDHSFVQALVASGHITPEQAKFHPMGHVLYRALGQSIDVDVDLYKRTLRAGDRFVICSDGLTRHINPEEIADIVLSTDDPAEATLDLVELTNSRGGEDNVSVVVLSIEDGDPTSGSDDITLEHI